MCRADEAEKEKRDLQRRLRETQGWYLWDSIPPTWYHGTVVVCRGLWCVAYQRWARRWHVLVFLRVVSSYCAIGASEALQSEQAQRKHIEALYSGQKANLEEQVVVSLHAVRVCVCVCVCSCLAAHVLVAGRHTLGLDCPWMHLNASRCVA